MVKSKSNRNHPKVNNDLVLKLDINDQQGWIFKKKQRVQEVFLFTNYEEGSLGRWKTPMREATKPKMKKRIGIKTQATHAIHSHKRKLSSCKSDENVMWPKIQGSFIDNKKILLMWEEEKHVSHEKIYKPEKILAR